MFSDSIPNLTDQINSLNLFELRLMRASLDALLMPKIIGRPIFYALFGFAKVYGFVRSM